MDRKMITIIVVIALLALGVGYASFSTTKRIKGTGSIDSNFDIKITNIEEGTKTGKAESITKPTFTSNTASFNTKLSRANDSIEYIVEINNKGSINGKVENIEIINPIETVSIEITGITKGEIIKAGEIKHYTVKVYIPAGTKINKDVTSKVEVNTEIIQDDNQNFNE